MNVLQHSFLFKELSEKEAQDFLKISQKISLKKNQPLFAEGDPANDFFIVSYGAIKVYKLTVKGDEQTLHILSQGQLIAEAAIFGIQQYPAHAKALEDSLLIKIPKKGFVSLIKTKPELSLKLMAGYSKKLREFVDMIEYLSLDDHKERIMKYLVKNSIKQNSKQICKLTTSKKELAQLLGMTPETLSRGLGELKKNGSITETNKDFILNDFMGPE